MLWPAVKEGKQQRIKRVRRINMDWILIVTKLQNAPSLRSMMQVLDSCWTGKILYIWDDTVHEEHRLKVLGML